MELFTELGALIENRWRSLNYQESSFPGIAAQVLSEFRLPERTDAWQIIRWVHSTTNLPKQMDLDADFGDPPITLYAGSRFYIDAYYWLDSTTSIHQHSFSGAFQLLLGSSVLSTYRFEQHQEINPRFLVGNISFNEVSLLGQGDIREIIAGPELIHSLFHLDRPSVTITIRTYKTPKSPVQYTYKKPFIAYDPFFKDQLLEKQAQTAGLLLSMKHPEADAIIGDLLASADFQTVYFILGRAFGFLCHRELEDLVGSTKSADRFHLLLNQARLRHGKLSDLLLPVFEETWRQSDIARRRDQIKDANHRFLLALLLNVPDHTNVLRLISERFPNQNPVELVVGWLKELFATKTFGSREPNVLGIAEFDESHFYVLRKLLQSGLPEDIGAATAAPEMTTPSQDLINHIRNLPLFKPIFAVSEAPLFDNSNRSPAVNLTKIISA